MWEGRTGDQIINYVASVRGDNRGIVKHADELAERLDLDTTKRVRDLSSGNKRKLGLVIAMMHSPELLVLDEPTGGLDPLVQQTFHEMMDECRAKGKTVFLSSHVLSEVQAICDRVGILRDGELKAVESVEKITNVEFHWVDVTFRDAIPAGLQQALESMPSITDVSTNGSRVRMRMIGDFDPLLRVISGGYVEMLHVEEPSLERSSWPFTAATRRTDYDWHRSWKHAAYIWKQILYWGLGLGVLGLYIDFIASSPDIISGYAELFETMPPALLQAFGASDVALFTTSEGWIVSIFVSEAAIFLSVFAVMAGLNITANDEQSGVMDVILSLPISRAAYMLERWIGYALIGLAITVLTAAITVAGIIGMNIDASQDVILKSILNLYPAALLVMTVTCLLATALPRRALAIGVSAAFVVVSYIFNVIGASASGAIADFMESVSYFSYIHGEAFVLGTYNPADSFIVIAAILVGFALSLRMFVSRDIGI